MNEPEGKITVVMPTGKRMDAIESIADAIAYNAQAAMSLAKVIENLEAPKIHIENVHIETAKSPAIVIKTEDSEEETGVYHWSESGHDEYDNGYPSETKLESGKIPEPYKEDFDEDEIEDMIEQGMYNNDEIPRVRGIYRKKILR